jgi:hypothetical protein
MALGDDKATAKQLANDLKRVSNSLKLDGKEWMARIVDDAITRLHNQKKSLEDAQAKIERQRENLREIREEPNA